MLIVRYMQSELIFKYFQLYFFILLISILCFIVSIPAQTKLQTYLQLDVSVSHQRKLLKLLSSFSS